MKFYNLDKHNAMILNKCHAFKLTDFFKFSNKVKTSQASIQIEKNFVPTFTQGGLYL